MPAPELNAKASWKSSAPTQQKIEESHNTMLQSPTFATVYHTHIHTHTHQTRKPPIGSNRLRHERSRTHTHRKVGYASHTCGAKHLHFPPTISASNGMAGKSLLLELIGQLLGGHGSKLKSRSPQHTGWSTRAHRAYRTPVTAAAIASGESPNADTSTTIVLDPAAPAAIGACVREDSP